MYIICIYLYIYNKEMMIIESGIINRNIDIQ